MRMFRVHRWNWKAMPGGLVPVTGLILLLVAFSAGCAHVTSEPVTPASMPPGIKKAETLCNEGHFAEALIECIDIAHEDPLTPGLADLRNTVMTALVERRAQRAALRSVMARKRMAVEVLEKENIPDTYGLRKSVRSETDSLQTPLSEMEKILRQPLSIHLKSADLSTFIDAISRDKNINIIADKALGKNKAIDIEVENTPLHEVMEYIARNMQVEFYVGKNVIWVTSPGSKAGSPMETRIYHLRKGLQFHGGDWGVEGKGKRQGDLPNLTEKATELSSEATYMENIIKRFVPAVEGSDLYLDCNMHVLIVRNTRANLKIVEQLVATLDVTPPQILIEARFVETTAADLGELGIDWILNGPLVTSSQYLMQDGAIMKVPSTQIESGDAIHYEPYTSGGQSAFPLGPQGPFALDIADGNKPTAEQGLNVAFRGILTEPEFQAVLHALNISGKTRTLSVPRVTTVNNNPAKLRNGEDLRYFEEFHAQAFSLRDANNRAYTITVLIPKGKPCIEETGITLIAVPSVGADMRTISLMLTPTISKVEKWTSYQQSSGTNDVTTIKQVMVKLPVISRKEVQTKVIVESEETVVLGGLIDTVQQDTVRSIPFLGDIPLLGMFFQRKDVTEQKRNLLIFVTAKVISGRGETLVAR